MGRYESSVIQPIRGVLNNFFMDFTGPLPKRKQFLLLAFEHLRALLIVKVTRKETSKVAVELVKEHIFGQFGMHRETLSDIGPGFIAESFNGIFEREWDAMENCECVKTYGK